MGGSGLVGLLVAAIQSATCLFKVGICEPGAWTVKSLMSGSSPTNTYLRKEKKLERPETNENGYPQGMEGAAGSGKEEGGADVST